MPQDFGKPISLTEANSLLKNYTDIQEKSRSHLKNMVRLLNAESISDGETYFKKEVNTYVFDKKLIKPYFEGDYTGAEYLIVVHGASVTDDPGNEIVKNEPTVMVAAAEGIRENGKVKGFKVYAPESDSDPIREHPPKYSISKLVTTSQDFKALFEKADKELEVSEGDGSLIFMLQEGPEHNANAAEEAKNVDSALSKFSGTGIEFGKPISLKDAKIILNDGIRIGKHKGLVRGALSTILDGKEKKEAIEYFTGDHAGFVFTKKQLQHLLSQIQDDEDCVVFFNGAREDGHSADKHHGKPSLVGFAYKKELNADKEIVALNRIANKEDAEDGEEHPPTIIGPGLKLDDGIPARIEAKDVRSLK